MAEAHDTMHPATGHRHAAKPRNCFVVMPFGSKPRRSDGKLHDFDKIYRVVIKRAVERAGMTCIRADETSGSRMIHTDMFRDLRDQPLVIVELSLHNPNVYYELGIRHVMSSSGTVLMCDTGSMPLPFDVGLSRVVTYDYDGASLDWEEAERLVDRLHVALLESGPGAPDSPVHALLERVLSDDGQTNNADEPTENILSGYTQSNLAPYIDLIVSKWRDDGADLSSLFAEHSGNVLGCSALGRYVLDDDKLSSEWAPRIASQLSDLTNFQLATEIYDRLHSNDLTNYRDLVRYANALSENRPDLVGASRALEIVGEALAELEETFKDDPEGPEAIDAKAYVERRRAGLLQWRWQLSSDAGDLEKAVASQTRAIALMEKARLLGTPNSDALAGPLAQSHLKRLLLLRIKSGDADLRDPAEDIQAILALRTAPTDDRKSTSYLRWYKTIALADSGAEDRVRQSALAAFAKDADLMHDGPEFAEIGRRQYSQIRRFLDQYLKWFRHPELIGLVGQTLQARR